jgi:hypothetical protein
VVKRRVWALLYDLRTYPAGRWGLERWGENLVWAAAIVVLATHWRDALAGAPAPWIALGGAFVMALALAVLRRKAAGESYLAFVASQQGMAPAPHRMPPAEKVALRATGWFEVDQKEHFFAGLQAYWRTFASEEHAVMAIVHPRRFCLFGQLPREDAGMWYIFFRPVALVVVVAGELAFGSAVCAGLRVTYRHEVPGHRRLWNFWRQPTTRLLERTGFLGFASVAERDQVWADLLADSSINGPAAESADRPEYRSRAARSGDEAR